MSQSSEPNAQNSEINPLAHPSGARIENMIRKAQACRDAAATTDLGVPEIQRPSEIEDAIVETPSVGHRRDPQSRHD